ncbi:MAG: hypothetical protein PWQ75_568 [Methanolobus sp.]|jgi:hypothetical protein|nr:hypothetical protein [Methanolobus sp.]
MSKFSYLFEIIYSQISITDVYFSDGYSTIPTRILVQHSAD